jgi:glycosyltransferase involved in cell wall biosynthesis
MTKLSVLVVHNSYRERGGEDSVFEAESALLESMGHRVERLLFDNADLPEHPKPIETVGLAVGTVWSRRGRARVRDAIERFRPDIVHFHNTLPQVSPAAYSVCHEYGAAVVQTLHNYRLVCPAGLLFRDGRPCEDCVGHSLALSGIAHACYRGSRGQTAAVAASTALHRLRGTWRHDVDLYISPSAFLRDKLIEGGLPADRAVVKPNFVADMGAGTHDGGHVLFAGRLTESKGIRTPLQAYRAHGDLPPLHVCGDGELAGEVEESAASDGRISFRRWCTAEVVQDEMRDACCLVLSSLWYENQPVALIEAFAAGLPVVASNIGALPELINDGRTGLLFRPGDPGDLASKLRVLTSDPVLARAMGRSARRTYEQLYTPASNYEQLIACYERARAEMKRRSGTFVGEKDNPAERIPARP